MLCFQPCTAQPAAGLDAENTDGGCGVRRVVYRCSALKIQEAASALIRLIWLENLHRQSNHVL
ncbi:hypothetical protein I7I50_08287 [Histoplasma capsulatum G186AR]|uniref:Uncharacterized protein n=1 Tax=Ajellomyces capsulatus TaxID=5037 RepID=A0A8H8CYT9_AJECA|nr:hypothetical protein I7I52_05803 [Histoplasma capsulatum]QSS73497.1 hypothetical protein I7I50_08287 [Histoplasma capsulatum G186AR]